MKGLVVVGLVLFSFFGTSFAQDSFRTPKWYVPDLLVAQYAGSIGFISAGAGYDIFKHRANLDVLVGVVPGFTGNEPLETITLKFNAVFFKKDLNPRITIYPLTTGVYFCYTAGREFTSKLPAWYPEGYYWWSEAIRFNLFVGGSVKFTTDWLKPGSRITAYYEIGTNEIKLVSYFQNGSTLSLWSILHAGIGVRYHFVR